MVITALALFGMVSMMTFAIDVSHWFDYSRNLQARADAAALAAGDAYGNVCFTGDPGDAATGAQSTVGKWAQLYSGAGVGEPSGNLPYADGDVATATGWDVLGNGYINNTTSAGSPVQSPLTLKAGSLSDYFLRLNADDYATKGGTNFSHGDFCAWDPTYDATDKQCFGQAHGQTTGPCAVGPTVDVKVTQRQLPNFIPIFDVHPNISAHARISLQGIQSEKGVRPLAVGDASYIPCVTANFLDNDGATVASEKLTRVGTTDTWTSIADAKAVPIPSGSNNPVTVQLFLNDCNSATPSGLHYDYYNDKGQETQLGLVYINNWGTPPAVGATGTPQAAAGGVKLTTGLFGSSCDPYFVTSAGTCNIGVHANVQFQPPSAGVSFFVRARIDGGNPIDLNNSAGGTDWDSGLNSFTVQPDSGPHTITIRWAQTGGTAGGNTCAASDPWQPSNKCVGTVPNLTQRTFAGTNGTNACNNPPFDTGPMQWIDVGNTDTGDLAGANAFARGANPHLYITTSIQGLANSQPGDPDICLRVAEQVSHATDFVDCGQGNGGSADANAIRNGCPVPPGIQVNTRVQPDGSLTCTPQIVPWDCVGNDPGQSSPILKAFDDLIGKGGAPANCADNNWGKVDADNNPIPITLADVRALPMIITGPTDLGTTNGGGQVPIRNFAVFYITGWSTGTGGVQGCDNNDDPPAGAGKGELWGHWTSLQVPSGLGTGNGKVCVPNQFGNCVAVLTR